MKKFFLFLNLMFLASPVIFVEITKASECESKKIADVRRRERDRDRRESQKGIAYVLNRGFDLFCGTALLMGSYLFYKNVKAHVNQAFSDENNKYLAFSSNTDSSSSSSDASASASGSAAAKAPTFWEESAKSGGLLKTGLTPKLKAIGNQYFSALWRSSLLLYMAGTGVRKILTAVDILQD